MNRRQTELSEMDKPLELVKPVPIVIEDYGDEIHASYLEIGAFGVGLTEAEAIANLKSEIRCMFDELKGVSDNKLGKLPLHWKRTLNNILKVSHDVNRVEGGKMNNRMKRDIARIMLHSLPPIPKVVCRRCGEPMIPLHPKVMVGCEGHPYYNSDGRLRVQFKLIYRCPSGSFLCSGYEDSRYYDSNYPSLKWDITFAPQ